MFRIGKSTETERLVVVRGWLGMTAIGYKISFGGWQNILELGVIFAQLCKYTKNHWIVYFKMIALMVCELYLNF